MIRVIGEYHFNSDDTEALDRATDVIMETLLGVDEVIEPDVAVSMAEQEMVIWLTFDTVDPMAAVEQAMRAVRMAFEAAGVAATGGAQVFLHRSLTELVDA